MEQIRNLATKLEALGLSGKEARVYVAALFLGAASVQKIAEQAGINRATAYVILDQLAKRGLVGQSREGKKAVFIAEGPEAFAQWFERAEREAHFKRGELEKLIPELRQTQRQDVTSAPVVRFFKGIAGIEANLEESMRRAKPKTVIYGFTDFDEARKIFPDVFQKVSQLRLRKKISSKVLYWAEEDVPSDPRLRRETRKLKAPPSADLNFYEDRAIFVTYRGRNSTWTVIDSPEIVKALRQLFALAWENASKNKNAKRG